MDSLMRRLAPTRLDRRCFFYVKINFGNHGHLGNRCEGDHRYQIGLVCVCVHTEEADEGGEGVVGAVVCCIISFLVQVEPYGDGGCGKCSNGHWCVWGWLSEYQIEVAGNERVCQEHISAS